MPLGLLSGIPFPPALTQETFLFIPQGCGHPRHSCLLATPRTVFAFHSSAYSEQVHIHFSVCTALYDRVSCGTAFFASTMYTFWEEGGMKLECALKGCFLHAPDGQGHAEASPWPTSSGLPGDSKSSYSAVPQESRAPKVVSAHGMELTLLWAGQRGRLLPIQGPQPNPAGPRAPPLTRAHACYLAFPHQAMPERWP